MKQESDLRPTKSYEIENIEGNRCEVVFFDLNSIEEVERVDEEGHTKIAYLYNAYRLNMAYFEGLGDYIDDNYEMLLNGAKTIDYNRVADEVRAKRNELLKNSDKQMAFDRLGFEIPSSITMTNIVTVIKNFFNTLKNIKTGDWAKYRQDLRDITEQEGFPYNVIFPSKPGDE